MEKGLQEEAAVAGESDARGFSLISACPCPRARPFYTPVCFPARHHAHKAQGCHHQPLSLSGELKSLAGGAWGSRSPRGCGVERAGRAPGSLCVGPVPCAPGLMPSVVAPGGFHSPFLPSLAGGREGRCAAPGDCLRVREGTGGQVCARV